MNINSILRANPRDGKYGAPMGARNYGHDAETPLYCQRINFIDGDYAPDGTYWGGGIGCLRLYCLFDSDGETRLYVRALNRKDAIREASETWPEIESRLIRA